MDIAEKIADYMVETGINNTSSGNYFFRYDGINQDFGCYLPKDYRLLDKIVNKVYEKYGVAICDLYYSDNPNDGFDFTFYLEYCPNAEDDDDNM